VSYGKRADQVAGALSRLLHVRAAEHNTTSDLKAHYLNLPAERLFPAPPAIERVELTRSLTDRVIHTTTVAWKSSHHVLCPRYRRRHENEYRKNLIGYARWLRPGGRPRKHCLVYVHGWLEPGSWVEEATLFRKWGRELDVDILHVALPFHGRRQPRSSLFSGEFFWTADLVRSVEGIRQTVCDTRAAIAWLYRQGYERIGVTGISLGGSIDMLLACLEPLPDYIVPIVAHLQLEDAVECAPILWRMKRDPSAGESTKRHGARCSASSAGRAICRFCRPTASSGFRPETTATSAPISSSGSGSHGSGPKSVGSRAGT